MIVRTFVDLAAEIHQRPARLGNVRLVVVDGPAGSGKSTFARRLGAALDRAPVFHLDDLYEGWSGLDGVWDRLDRWVLRPLACGYPARYRKRDWSANRFASWRLIPVPPVLVVEGCGAAQRAADRYATLRIWVEAPSALRLERGIARDGEHMRAEWLRWREAEDKHFTAEDTRIRADLRVNGAPQVPHDAEREFALTPDQH